MKYGNSNCSKAFSACKRSFNVSKIFSISCKPTGPKVCKHSTKRLMWVPRISWGKSTAKVTLATVCWVPLVLSRSSMGQRKSLMPTCFKGTQRKSFSPCTSFISHLYTRSHWYVFPKLLLHINGNGQFSAVLPICSTPTRKYFLRREQAARR